MEVLKEYPESEIFLIPVRLDDCQPSHEKLFELHRVDMFPSWDEGMEEIIKAVRLETPKRTYSAEQRKEIIIRIIADVLGVDESGITPDISLEDLGGDWLDAFKIQNRLEEEFEIEISEEDAKGMRVVADVFASESGAGA